MVRLAILSLLLHASVTRGNRDDQSSVLNVDQHAKGAGQTFTNRLDALGKPSDLQLDFPFDLKGTWGNDDELGMGSFGAVWKATAKKGACRDCEVGKEYAIKVFYRKEEENRGIVLTWARATPPERRELNGVSEECTLGRKLANVNGPNDERRKYIMNCVEDRVGHRGRKPDDILFLVLEMGGTSMDRYWEKHGSNRSVDELKSVMRQSMEALAFLAEPGKGQGYVHHDLKSENMVLHENSAGGLDAMLIDFGATLKSDVFSADANSVSNTNAPPEWGKHAFNSRFPFAFDTFCMGNVFIELLTGKPLVDMYYTGSRATHTAYDRTLWCRREKLISEECEFWHTLEVWRKYIQRRDLDRAAIIDLVQHRDSKAPTGIQRHFFDQLKNDKDFLAFLDVIGSMLSHYAGSRPSAKEVLQSAFLTGRSSKLVAPQVSSVKKPVTEKPRVPTQEQAKQPVQAFKPGAGFESLGDGLCKNAAGTFMSNVLMYRDPGEGEDSPFKECQKWCSEDLGCFGYATGMDGSGKYMCRIYTLHHKDYLESGFGKSKVEQVRGLGGKWKAPGSYDFNDIEPIQGSTPGGRQSTCFRKMVDHQVVVDDDPDTSTAKPDTVEDKKHPVLPQTTHSGSAGPSTNEVKSLSKVSMKKETVAHNDFAQGQGAFVAMGKGMCKSEEGDNMSNIYAETKSNKAAWVKKCEEWCKEDGGCFGYAITDHSSGTMCRLHTKNYADYVETGYGRGKTLQTRGEGGTWQTPGSYDFEDVGEIIGILMSGNPTECFRKVQ